MENEKNKIPQSCNIDSVIKCKVDKRKTISYRDARELAFGLVQSALMRERLVRTQEILLRAKEKDPTLDIGDSVVYKRFDELDFGKEFDGRATESGCF
jgi:hypothetical protein